MCLNIWREECSPPVASVVPAAKALVTKKRVVGAAVTANFVNCNPEVVRFVWGVRWGDVVYLLVKNCNET